MLEKNKQIWKERFDKHEAEDENKSKINKEIKFQEDNYMKN